MYARIYNWGEAAAYATWLVGSLPSEAQWEFAARGEEGREYPWGPGPARSGTHGNWNSDETVPVGSFPEEATPLGVHDMAGNVWEWCSDRYGTYLTDAPKDYEGPDEGTTGCCGAGRSTSTRGTSAPPTASGTIPSTATSASGFVWWCPHSPLDSDRPTRPAVVGGRMGRSSRVCRRMDL
ncbi:MAG: SUMF1/EgtB/PvdO family nonheme iron enzyme [Acidobacteria bacterium]|nr:SUMF1/EgtB/PvdO family nonheme iron enzyme [Acidobacteriota bacterium]